MNHCILIPLDGSDFSRKILPSVSGLFPPGENELILLRVASSLSGVTAPPPLPLNESVPILLYRSQRDVDHALHPIYASQARQNLEGALLDELAVDAQPLRNKGYTVSTAVRIGNPASEIVKFVASEKIDAVAMTTHGRSGISGAILGSVAQQVLRHSSAPVLLLHPIS